MESLIMGVFLAYYWTGVEMVAFHTISPFWDRPSYVKGPMYKKAFSAMLWPVIAPLNQEFGWFFSCFIAYAAVFTVIYSLSISFAPIWAIVLAIGILRTVPFISVVVNAPSALVATLVFLPLSKIFGWQVPEAMSRLITGKSTGSAADDKLKS